MADLTIIETPRKRKFYPRKPRKIVRKSSKIKPRRKKGHITIGDDLIKLWTLKKADRAFSEEIRTRDGRCLHPAGCGVTNFEKLQCSHFIGRATKSTRFDPDNCISLCWLHHFKDKLLGFEYQKQTLENHGWDGQYTLFMKNRLGPTRYAALMERSKQSIKQRTAIENYQKLARRLMNPSSEVTPKVMFDEKGGSVELDFRK